MIYSSLDIAFRVAPAILVTSRPKPSTIWHPIVLISTNTIAPKNIPRVNIWVLLLVRLVITSPFRLVHGSTAGLCHTIHCVSKTTRPPFQARDGRESVRFRYARRFQ